MKINTINQNAKILKLPFILGTILFLNSSAFASSGAHHVPSIMDLTWYFINFVIFFGALYLLLRKKMLAAWQVRSERIAAEVVKGETALAEAQKQYAELEKSLKNLPKEIEQLKVNWAQNASNEIKHMRSVAEQEKEHLQQNAVKLVAAEKNAFERELRQELAEHVYAEAEKRILAEQGQEKDQARRAAVLDKYVQVNKN